MRLFHQISFNENGANCGENYGIEFRAMMFVFFGYVDCEMLGKCWVVLM